MVDSGKLSPEARASAEEGALLNASRHGGKAEVGAVLGRILGEFPSLRADSAAVAKEVAAIVGSVNAMSPQQQETFLKERYPEAGSEEQKRGRVGLPPLRNAVKGKAGFRLPPEPSGFMTVGHAMAFTINYIYKETYQGELWLRFEDTNPRKVAPQYYESFRRGIDWLSIKCDHEKNVSDDIPLIYGYGKKLVQQGDAYACGCEEVKVKRLRFDGVPCEHRNNSVERNLEVWDGLVGGKYKEGEWVIRIKGDMSSQNFSLRDSNLFRVIDKPHPLVGSKYSLWPTYDIANAVEDEVCRITHVLRSSEFRNELQQVIREKLGFRAIEVIQFSRFNFKGTPVSKRLLRPLVEQKVVTGWDDPRMPTVDGMRRRGIIPQAIREFTLQVGYTKTEHEYDWSLLLAVNRKLLDPATKRLFFVPDPVKVKVSGAETREVDLRLHPQSNL
ncbi:MAG TPA: glutamate--tRNA ligase family protein, partial [Nitrososphaerales archaeon]|nr:glutamate--tRNA ligase family protein [Nitrososphaerales archaeon]